MLDSVFIEVIAGVGRVFLHPFFYLLLIFGLILGIQRVKRERKDFNSSVYDAFTELRQMIFPGIIAGLAVSLLTIGVGVILPVGVIVLIGVISVLFLITFQVRWLSPAYTIGLSILVALFLTEVKTNTEILDQWLQEIVQTPLFILSLLLGVMMLLEGILILLRGSIKSSPFLQRSKRGKVIGLHEAKRLWLIPVVFLIPDGTISSVMDWWPLLHFGSENYALILTPFGIGFQQNIRSMLPQEAIKVTSKKVVLLSILVIICGILAFTWKWFAIVSAIIAIAGREAINFRQRVEQDENISFFTVRDHGMVILGVIPKSPAEKMALKIGEIITKVNGKSVRNVKEFYDALQKNRAFCKLEVLDFNGEVRFVQRALYSGEHHELGVLFVNNGRE